MVRQPLLLGAHISISGGFYKAVETGQEIGCTCIQVFTKSNRQWSAKPIEKNEMKKFHETIKKTSISRKHIIAHSSYLINLGSSKSDIHKKSMSSLQEELNRCELLKIPYLVIHPGSHGINSLEESLDRIALSLNSIFDRVPGKTMILLETMAGQGINVCYTFEQISTVLQQIKSKKRIGVCFDTCHVFAAGYDLRTKKEYENTWKKFDTIIGFNYLKAIHINDSKKELGSKVDRHEHIGKGKLGLAAFKYLFNDHRFFHIPKILETPKEADYKDDIKNMSTIRTLITKNTKILLK